MTAAPPPQPTAPPAVTESDPKVLAWVALADELAPAKSLARIDAATTRVITTVTVLGTVLTGLGLLAAGLPTGTDTSRGLATAALITAVIAVICALAAQILTIEGRLNTRNIAVLRSWYQQQFRRRAYPARAATIFLAMAILLAGAASITALVLPQQNQPIIGISQTETAAAKTPTDAAKTTVTVEATFRSLPPNETLILTVTTGGSNVARSAITAQPDGSATRTITIADIPNNSVVNATAIAGNKECTATLTTKDDRQPLIKCRP
jgi:lysylphosphatidylglycerol synthetase-like protein (DUF2156 family)